MASNFLPTFESADALANARDTELVPHINSTTENEFRPAFSYNPVHRNAYFDNVISNDTRKAQKIHVLSIEEGEEEKHIVYKKCIGSLFSNNPDPSSYIFVENPRLNLKKGASDSYPKTLIESIIKNSHDSRSTRILSSQFETCVPITVEGETAFVSTKEATEMKYLGRHPDQLEGFSLRESKLAKSFIPLFLTFMLLLLFSKR